MDHIRCFAAIFTLSAFVAMLVTPADPLSMMIAMTALLVVASLAYGLGIRTGARSTRARPERAADE